MLDKIDEKLVKGCRDNAGSPLNKIIEPLLVERHEGALRARLRRLEALGYVTLDRTSYRGKVLCFITEKGIEELGRIEAQTSQGGEPLGSQ
jgi:DNA-binding PadR family transcriptional regulator